MESIKLSDVNSVDERFHYYQQMLEKLPESKVIFIVDDESEKNVEPILHIKRTVKETGKIMMIKVK